MDQMEQEKMKHELERISKEHDQERRRLEVTLQGKKARNSVTCLMQLIIARNVTFIS